MIRLLAGVDDGPAILALDSMLAQELLMIRLLAGVDDGPAILALDSMLVVALMAHVEVRINVDHT